MISCRIFLCHCVDQKDPQEVQVLNQLQEQLGDEGAEIVLYPGAIDEEGFFPFLAAELTTCQWFICVQTPQASHSPQMRIAVNTVLKLLAQRQLLGASRLVLTVEQEDTPEEWSAIPAFDATQDVARALAKLRLNLTAKNTVPALLVAPSPSVPALPPSPTYDRPTTKPVRRKGVGDGQSAWNNGSAPPRKLSALSALPRPQGNWPPLLFRRRVSRRVFFAGLAGLFIGGGLTLAGELVLRGQQAPVVSASSGGIPVQAISPGTALTTYSGHSAAVNAVAWAPDGVTMASASDDKTVQIWSGRNGQPLLAYREHTAPVTAIAWAPDSWLGSPQLIASGGSDTTVRIWTVSNGITRVIYQGHNAQVNSVNWVRGAWAIASASSDRTVQVWNTSDGSKVTTYTGHKDIVHTAVWLSDGSVIASASGDGTVQVWGPFDHNTLYQKYTGHKGSVNALVCDPQQEIIASGGSDGTIQVWQISNGKPLFICTGHTDAITTLAMSPDGQFLVSGSADKTLRIWDAWNGGKQVLVYQGYAAPVYTVAWSSIGPYIASGGKETAVQLWEGEA